MDLVIAEQFFNLHILPLTKSKKVSAKRLFILISLLSIGHFLWSQGLGATPFIRVEGRVCMDSTLTFQVAEAEGATSWRWDFGDGNTSGQERPRHVFTIPGEYPLRVRFVTADARPDSTELELTIYDCQDKFCEPDAYMEIGFDGAPCTVDSINFFPVTTLDLRFYEWRWNDELLTYRREGTLVFEEEEAANLTLKSIDTLGCAYTSFVDLDIRPCVIQCKDSLRINYTGIPCADNPLSFSAESNAELTEWTWEFGDGILSGEAKPSVEFVPGTYQILLTAKSPDGCTYSASKEVIIREDCTPSACALGLPDAFSPNNDGLNDRFGPLNQCEPGAYTLRIFDRWGNLAFESVNPEIHWDGQSDGQPAAPGVYAWMVRYQTSVGEKMIVESGTVLLLR